MDISVFDQGVWGGVKQVAPVFMCAAPSRQHLGPEAEGSRSPGCCWAPLPARGAVGTFPIASHTAGLH